MLLGRRAEELAQPGWRGSSKRSLMAGRVSVAAGENLSEPSQDRAWESATGQRPRLGRTHRTAGSRRVDVHPVAACNMVGSSAAHGALQPPRPVGKRGNSNPSSANSHPL